MNERVAKFLERKRNEEASAKRKHRQKTLLDLKLYDIVYAPQNQNYQSDEYPYYQWDDATSTGRYYKCVPIEVTDEEYAEIEKYATSETKSFDEEPVLFKNIGNKIKGLAQLLCWVGSIISIVIAFVNFSQAAESSYGGEIYSIMGVVYLIVVPILCWITSWFLYGFGELINRVTNIDRKLK